MYNHRSVPQGLRCCISEVAGRTSDTSAEHVLWDQSAHRITAKPIAKSTGRAWDGTSMSEMFTWDFGGPHATTLDDGSVFITFYATDLDHIMHQRYVRLKIE